MVDAESWNPRARLWELTSRDGLGRGKLPRTKVVGNWFEGWIRALVDVVVTDAGIRWHVGHGHISDGLGWFSPEFDLLAIDRGYPKESPEQSVIFPEDAALGIHTLVRPEAVRLIGEAKAGGQSAYDVMLTIRKIGLSVALQKCPRARAVYAYRAKGSDWRCESHSLPQRVEEESGLQSTRLAILAFPLSTNPNMEREYLQATRDAIDKIREMMSGQ